MILVFEKKKKKKKKSFPTISLKKRSLTVVDEGDLLSIMNDDPNNQFKIIFQKSRITFINYEYKGFVFFFLFLSSEK